MCDISVKWFHIYPPGNDIKMLSFDYQTLKVKLDLNYMDFSSFRISHVYDWLPNWEFWPYVPEV